MSLWILLNNLSDRVINDLTKICPDPGLAINPNNGKITYNQTMSSVGCDLVAKLINHASWIAIRGEVLNFSIRPIAGRTLKDVGGATIYDKYPDPTTVTVVYSVTNCDGRGFWVNDARGDRTSLPCHVLLFHELAHALQMCMGTFNQAYPESAAVADENIYRESMGMPLRVGYDGGCNVYTTPITYFFLSHKDPTTYIYEDVVFPAVPDDVVVAHVKNISNSKMTLIHDGREFLFDPKNNPTGVTQAFNGLKLEGYWRALIESLRTPWRLNASILIEVEWRRR